MPRKNVPKECGCNCGGWTVNGEFLPGHKNRLPDVARSIGEKNSQRMQSYLQQNPSVASQRVEQMRAGKTTESEARRIESTRKTYDRMSDDEVQKFSEHATDLWSKNREKMMAGVAKGIQTKKERHEQYLRDGGFGSETWRENVSAGISQKYLEGGFQWSRGSYTAQSGRTYHFRSSWELQRMQELDADSIVLEWD